MAAATVIFNARLGTFTGSTSHICASVIVIFTSRTLKLGRKHYIEKTLLVSIIFTVWRTNFMTWRRCSHKTGIHVIKFTTKSSSSSMKVHERQSDLINAPYDVIHKTVSETRQKCISVDYLYKYIVCKITTIQGCTVQQEHDSVRKRRSARPTLALRRFLCLT